MDLKKAYFGHGIKTSQVAYVIVDKTIYFTQCAGVFSSINGAEYIVKSISEIEKLDWHEYMWVDIQTEPRYSEYAQDVLVFDQLDAEPSVYGWRPVEVTNEVLQSLSIIQ